MEQPLQAVEQFITVENLTKTYKRGKVKAVNGATFHVDRGEIFGLIGPNGAGKTTIMGCLLALVKASSGEIRIDGKSPQDLDVKRMTGFLPERPCYNRWMTVHQFLSFHHMLAELPASQMENDIARVLALVELEVQPRKRHVRELSRGMLQRLGLAQAFIARPTLMFFDEPTSGMDPLGFILMRKILKGCKDDGITVILNSHHLHEVEKVCDRVAFIRKGKIEYQEYVEALSQSNSIVIVRWYESETIATKESFSDIAERRHAKLIAFEDCLARFTVTDKLGAAELLTELVGQGIKVYEVTFEKRELVDLFLSTEESTSADPQQLSTSLTDDKEPRGNVNGESI